MGIDQEKDHESANAALESSKELQPKMVRRPLAKVLLEDLL
jgi:hypothetical protein